MRLDCPRFDNFMLIIIYCRCKSSFFPIKLSSGLWYCIFYLAAMRLLYITLPKDHFKHVMIQEKKTNFCGIAHLYMLKVKWLRRVPLTFLCKLLLHITTQVPYCSFLSVWYVKKKGWKNSPDMFVTRLLYQNRYDRT